MCVCVEEVAVILTRDNCHAPGQREPMEDFLFQRQRVSCLWQVTGDFLLPDQLGTAPWEGCDDKESLEEAKDGYRPPRIRLFVHHQIANVEVNVREAGGKDRPCVCLSLCVCVRDRGAIVERRERQNDACRLQSLELSGRERPTQCESK